jgi:hypothetical protein
MQAHVYPIFCVTLVSPCDTLSKAARPVFIGIVSACHPFLTFYVYIRIWLLTVSAFLLDYKIIVRIAWRFGFLFVYLHPTQVALKGEWVILLWQKDVYERYLRRENLANSRPEDTQLKRPLWVYCTLSVFWTPSIYLGVGYLELLILVKAMREPSRGIGEVEHPRLSV